ncbi:MAG: hypothetical protein ACE5HA_19470, partial [Anaerolineae bacterium]
MWRKVGSLLPVVVILALSSLTGSVVAQGPTEQKFGIGEADWGGNINWGAQSSYTALAHAWRPDASTTTRQVYTGPDAIGTYIFVHSPDTLSEGPTHFGPVFNGPVSNGASDPLVNGHDLFWVGNHEGDRPIDSNYAAPDANYYDSALGHYYNLNHHDLMGPGGHHLHDTNGDGYINCFDIQGFNPGNGVATCDGVNQTGPNDGVYVEQLNTFLTFVQDNPGRAWAIGGEIQLAGGKAPVDPFMYAVYIKNIEDRIHQTDPTAKVYIKDVGNLWGALDCSKGNLCGGDVINEPGTSPTLDGGDWWYTVAVHYNNLNYDPEGHIDGFLTDMGIGSDDDYNCWDAQANTITPCTAISPTWVLPADSTQPTDGTTGQWLEYRRRPFAIEHDRPGHGGYAWNATQRYLQSEVLGPLLWLVANTYHTPIAELFGNAPTPVSTETYGAGGKAVYWGNPAVPGTDQCSITPFGRYNNVVSGRAQNEGNGSLGGNDRSAGYVVCDFRDGLSGIRVPTSTASFDYAVFQGIGQARRQYREDLNSDGDITDAGEGTPRVEPLPQSTGQREDSLLVSGI